MTLNDMPVWIRAARPRTLLLAISTVGMGTFIAATEMSIDWFIFILTLLTAILLQTLSNLANDYGDFVHGADAAGRKGPTRAVQSGKIPPTVMRRAIIWMALASCLSGSLLIFAAAGIGGLFGTIVLMLSGALAIWAAISYTAGNHPYGYVGFGDVAVFVFFGWVGVLGTYTLQTHQSVSIIFLPATSVGLFSVGVLNVNNIRDYETDKRAGKYSLPVRFGLTWARRYHWFLLIGGLFSALFYVFLDFYSGWQLLFLITSPLIIQNAIAITRNPPGSLNPYLGRLSMATVLFVLTFGVGFLVGQ